METKQIDDARARLEAEHGKVWSTSEMRDEFLVLGFALGMCVVERKSDRVRGCLRFTHMPRFYFDFTPEYDYM